MKKIFKKAVTVLGSIALVGATVGGAAAAAYPAPFGTNYAVVYGAGSQDSAAATTIAGGLPDLGGTTGTTGSVTGESKSLNSGSDLLYLNDEFSENIQTLTKADLPTVLADSKFTNDDGTDYDFEQILTIGTSTNNGFEFGNSDNDLDDPALMLKLSTTATATNAIYDLTATFNTAVPFNATASEGEDITIFGKTYTVGTATDGDTLVLLGGAGSVNVNVGETKTITVGGTSYDVLLNGLSSASTTQASITINGDTKTFTQGQTKTVGGVDAYVKTVFRTGDTGDGYAEVQLGAGKLTFETGNAVQVGSDNDDIDGTLVTITGGVNAMTVLKITVAAEDNDVNHLLVGESFVDPVFGTVIVNFDGVTNGPTFSAQKDIGRTDFEIRKGGNRELQLVLTDNGANTATVPFTYNNVTQDDATNTIALWEGASIADDGYFILNSGNNQHFMQITKLNTDAGANSDVAMKDIITGETYTFDNHNFATGYSATISGQTYNITNDTSATVTVVSSDFGEGITNGDKFAVFPYIELVSGEDTRFAFTDDVTTVTNFITNVSAGLTMELPTGDMAITTNTTADVIMFDGTVIVADGSDDSLLVGDVWYNFMVEDGSTTNGVNITVAIDTIPGTGVGDVPVITPGILFVEDEDKSQDTATTKTAIHIVTTDTAGYTTVSTPLFTGISDTETWDNTDYVGYLTNYGTYAWKYTGDTNQNFVGLSYGNDIMSADVSIAEGTATEGTTSTGQKTFMDSETSSYTGKNLIVVGGSCVNSVAETLLGGKKCAADFTSVTSVAQGGFLIQTFDYSGKLATVVAGYDKEDTTKAATYLANAVSPIPEIAAGATYVGVSATESAVRLK
jgi:hypothetical protein